MPPHNSPPSPVAPPGAATLVLVSGLVAALHIGKMPPALPVLTFPGNLGDGDTLRLAWRWMEGLASAD